MVTTQAGKAEGVLFGKIFCTLFGVGKGISKRKAVLCEKL